MFPLHFSIFNFYKFLTARTICMCVFFRVRWSLLGSWCWLIQTLQALCRSSPSLTSWPERQQTQTQLNRSSLPSGFLLQIRCVLYCLLNPLTPKFIRTFILYLKKLTYSFHMRYLLCIVLSCTAVYSGRWVEERTPSRPGRVLHQQDAPILWPWCPAWSPGLHCLLHCPLRREWPLIPSTPMTFTIPSHLLTK